MNNAEKRIIPLLLAVVLSGCGGGTSDDNPSQNTLPTIQVQDMALEVMEDKELKGQFTATTQSAEAITFVIETPTSRGSISVQGNNFEYIPNQDFFGSDTFSYRAKAGDLVSEAGTVTLTVVAQNDSPVTESIAVDIEAGSETTVKLNASDVDSEQLSFLLTSEFEKAIVQQPESGDDQLTISVPYGVYGEDQARFVVNDGQANSTEEVIELSISVPSSTAEGRLNEYELDDFNVEVLAKTADNRIVTVGRKFNYSSGPTQHLLHVHGTNDEIVKVVQLPVSFELSVQRLVAHSNGVSLLSVRDTQAQLITLDNDFNITKAIGFDISLSDNAQTEYFTFYADPQYGFFILDAGEQLSLVDFDGNVSKFNVRDIPDSPIYKYDIQALKVVGDKVYIGGGIFYCVNQCQYGTGNSFFALTADLKTRDVTVTDIGTRYIGDDVAISDNGNLAIVTFSEIVYVDKNHKVQWREGLFENRSGRVVIMENGDIVVSYSGEKKITVSRYNEVGQELWTTVHELEADTIEMQGLAVNHFGDVYMNFLDRKNTNRGNEFTPHMLMFDYSGGFQAAVKHDITSVNLSNNEKKYQVLAGDNKLVSIASGTDEQNINTSYLISTEVKR
ncbi:Ig-like domain-containing protein [Pseudoalteromonas byunsanensis]|uniref:Cadherin-like domain-containing protein n=1 Tax=Pseudoalteromonas byunsanensis TaxID=327939 RepID=A0A1S1NFF4_9GAMM|nr:Ig-like domain-containing protein [Pseudoalteromonas byunsanensis]OHU97183.1 hypothetical protein BIW53_02355 [Pseudoalteromonas byunsanensis]